MEAEAQRIDYEPGEEHILRRLGGAVVVLWDNLPGDSRNMILSQAMLMLDRDPAVQLGEQIEAFIEKYKPALNA
jgi:hypothetical protein